MSEEVCAVKRAGSEVCVAENPCRYEELEVALGALLRKDTPSFQAEVACEVRRLFEAALAVETAAVAPELLRYGGRFPPQVSVRRGAWTLKASTLPGAGEKGETYYAIIICNSEVPGVERWLMFNGQKNPIRLEEVVHPFAPQAPRARDRMGFERDRDYSGVSSVATVANFICV